MRKTISSQLHIILMRLQELPVNLLPFTENLCSHALEFAAFQFYCFFH